jgi:Na+/H+ antiporter NhaA
VLEFIATQTTSAVVLLTATVAALVWANSPWSATYEHLWETPLAVAVGGYELSMSLRHWINDGLMTFFFFVAGLEIRREFDMGELRERRRVATPVVAALGGVMLPALTYLAFNASGSAARGWGIAMGTDTAFALAVLSMVGGRWTDGTRTFLLTLVVFDDIVALSVIALAYTDQVSPVALLSAVALYGCILGMRRSGVRNGLAYFLVGALMWLATLASGIHPTVAGVVVGLAAYAYPPTRAELEQAGARWRLFREQPTPEYARAASRGLALTISPNERLQYMFHPWTGYVVVPLFALANAGVTLDAEAIGGALGSPVTWGVFWGLVAGKPLGIALAAWLFSRRWLGGFPLTVPWPPLFAAATLGGIGFTVGLLVASISLQGAELEHAKMGIFAGSLVSSGVAYIAFRLIERLPRRWMDAGRDRMAADLIDLIEAVDPGVDHVRGPADARVTLVEYGDFECPNCGQAEGALRALLRDAGREFRFVFRHLPLTDVHGSAQLAAEASEAAAAQGRFWEMHDLLFDSQDKLTFDDLVDHAAALGLDVDQFEGDLRTRRHARRVARDVASATEGGVAGTPTFFVDGRRYYGAYDLVALKRAIGRP